MIVAKNVCSKKVIVGGKDILPGRTVRVESLDCIESKVNNGFLEVVEKEVLVRKKGIVKEVPKRDVVMETEKIIEEDE